MIEEGSPAPDFELQTDTGDTVRLSSLRGKPVVLYFYPKDHTSGCTTQACGHSRRVGRVRARGRGRARRLPDDVASHESFRADYELPFTLLADPDHKVAEAYGVWSEKSRYGRTYMGIVRSTFVIAPDGTIEKVMRNVKPATHADDVLAVLSAAA